MHNGNKLNIRINRQDPTPLYHQLKLQIKTGIKKGKIFPGQKISSERELMQKYNLSYYTVTHALNDLVQEGYIKRIQGKGTFINDPSARKRLDKKHLNLIGLTFPHLDANRILYTSRIIKGAEEEARKNGFQLIISNDEDDKEMERKHIEGFYRNGVDGIIIQYIGERVNIDCLEKLKKENVPFILVDHYTPYIETDYVTSDNLLGAYSVTKKLIELGYRRIFYIGDDENQSAVIERRKGWEKALKERNLKISSNFLGQARFPDYIETAYHLAKDKFSDAPSHFFAVFAVNPPALLGVWKAIQDLGMDTQHLTLSCFDEPPQEISKDIPMISAIQSVEEMGKQAVQGIINKLNGDVNSHCQVILKPELVFNDSFKNRELALIAERG